MCRRVQGSQIFKQNWIISICSRVIVILLIFVYWGVGQVGGGCLGWSTIVYMSSGMFRGKESSNRIELSQLVQELLNFGVLGFLQLLGVGVGWMGWGWVDDGGGWVDGVGGGWGCPHTCAHACACTHAHARTCMHGKHGNFMQMATPHWGNPWEFPMMSYAHACACTCMHVCACACGWGAPSHHPPTPHPGIIQNSIRLELIEIFQFCLKIWNLWRLPHPWVGV